MAGTLTILVYEEKNHITSHTAVVSSIFVESDFLWIFMIELMHKAKCTSQVQFLLTHCIDGIIINGKTYH